MSGHSKWAQIKRQKGANDTKRGQLFTKLGREISVATRQGGPDPEGNFRLRLVIQHARANNMPMENIERAIKRGAGSGDTAQLEEIVYEGYGPSGVAVMVEAMTDNRNRTVSEIRNAFMRAGGSLGESGCVAWQFNPRGVVTVDAKGRDHDELELLAIDAGAIDVKSEDDSVEIYTEPGDLDRVRKVMEENKAVISSVETTMVAETTIDLDGKTVAQVLKLIDKLEDLDDVQRVHTNVEISEEALEQYGA